MIALRCEVWYQGLFQDQRSSIVLMNRYLDCSFSYGKTYLFSKIFSNIYHANKFLQLWTKETIYDFIYKRDVAVCSFYYHK